MIWITSSRKLFFNFVRSNLSFITHKKEFHKMPLKVLLKYHEFIHNIPKHDRSVNFEAFQNIFRILYNIFRGYFSVFYIRNIHK